MFIKMINPSKFQCFLIKYQLFQLRIYTLNFVPFLICYWQTLFYFLKSNMLGNIWFIHSFLIHVIYQDSAKDIYQYFSSQNTNGPFSVKSHVPLFRYIHTLYYYQTQLFFVFNLISNIFIIHRYIYKSL